MVYGEVKDDDPDPVHLVKDLVKAILMTLVVQKSVLLTSKFNARAVEKEALSALMHIIGHIPACITCKESTTIEMLHHDLSQLPGEIILITRINVLSPRAQLALARAITLRKVAVDGREKATPSTFILTGSREETIRRLKNRILMSRNIEIDPDTSYVVPNQLAFHDILSNFKRLSDRVAQVVIHHEIYRYMQDIVTFVRTHRLVQTGVHPTTMPDLQLVARLLCVFNNQEFLTPLLAVEAARLVLPLRIELCASSDEPSTVYGGNISTIEKWLSQWDANLIVDSIIETVPVPV